MFLTMVKLTVKMLSSVNAHKMLLALCFLMFMANVNSQNRSVNFSAGLGSDFQYLTSGSQQKCTSCITDSTKFYNKGGYSIRPYFHLGFTLDKWFLGVNLSYDLSSYKQEFSYSVLNINKASTFNHSLRYAGYSFLISRNIKLTDRISFFAGGSAGVLLSLNRHFDVRLPIIADSASKGYINYRHEYYQTTRFNWSIYAGINKLLNPNNDLYISVYFDHGAPQYHRVTFTEENTGKNVLFFEEAFIPLNRIGFSFGMKHYFKPRIKRVPLRE